MNCEKCGAECERDEVDVGVVIIHGPWGCPICGWSESPEYDISNGPKYDANGWVLDQKGGATPPKMIDPIFTRDYMYYIHVKTGTRYKVSDFDVFHTETGEMLVCYEDKQGKRWARPSAMFHDGRFTVDPNQDDW